MGVRGVIVSANSAFSLADVPVGRGMPISSLFSPLETLI